MSPKRVEDFRKQMLAPFTRAAQILDLSADMTAPAQSLVVTGGKTEAMTEVEDDRDLDEFEDEDEDEEDGDEYDDDE